jgi:hypothetical protein
MDPMDVGNHCMKDDRGFSVQMSKGLHVGDQRIANSWKDDELTGKYIGISENFFTYSYCVYKE